MKRILLLIVIILVMVAFHCHGQQRSLFRKLEGSVAKPRVVLQMFDDTFVNGFGNIGSNAAAMNISTAQHYIGTSSLYCSLTAWANIGLTLGTWGQTPCVNYTTVDSIHFMIYCTTAGETYDVYLTKNDGGGISDQVTIHPPQNAWAVISLPLSAFNVTQDIWSVNLYEYSGQATVFYIDDACYVLK